MTPPHPGQGELFDVCGRPRRPEEPVASGRAAGPARAAASPAAGPPTAAGPGGCPRSEPAPPAAGARRRPVGREERRKGRGAGWIWAVIAVIVLCCALTSCGMLFGGFGALLGGRATAQDALKKADAHWMKAVAELDRMNVVLAKAGTIDPKSPSKAIAGIVTPAKKGIASARAELKLAGAALSPLGKSVMKTSYVGAIGEADKSLVEFEAMLAYLTKVGKLYEYAVQGAADLKRGAGFLDEAVTAANKGNFAAGDASPRAVPRSRWPRPARRSLAGDKLDKTAGFKKALAYVTKLDEEASVLKRLADAGTKKQAGLYNSLAAQQRTLQGQVAKLPLPDLVAQKDWAKARLDTYLKTIKTRIEAADKLQKAAHTAFDQGKF